MIASFLQLVGVLTLGFVVLGWVLLCRSGPTEVELALLYRQYAPKEPRMVLTPGAHKARLERIS